MSFKEHQVHDLVKPLTDLEDNNHGYENDKAEAYIEHHRIINSVGYPHLLFNFRGTDSEPFLKELMFKLTDAGVVYRSQDIVPLCGKTRGTMNYSLLNNNPYQFIGRSPSVYFPVGSSSNPAFAKYCPQYGARSRYFYGSSNAVFMIGLRGALGPSSPMTVLKRPYVLGTMSSFSVTVVLSGILIGTSTAATFPPVLRSVANQVILGTNNTQLSSYLLHIDSAQKLCFSFNGNKYTSDYICNANDDSLNGIFTVQVSDKVEMYRNNILIYSTPVISLNRVNMYTSDFSSGIDNIVPNVAFANLHITGGVSAEGKSNLLKVENNTSCSPQLGLSNTLYKNSDCGVMEFEYFVPSDHPIVGKYWHVGTQGTAAGEELSYSVIGEKIIGGAWTTAKLLYGNKYDGNDKEGSTNGRLITVLDQEVSDGIPSTVHAHDGDFYYISSMTIFDNEDQQNTGRDFYLFNNKFANTRNDSPFRGVIAFAQIGDYLNTIKRTALYTSLKTFLEQCGTPTSLLT